MPNWCDTEVAFVGENVEKLYNDWQEADKKFKKEGAQHWLGRLFLYKNVLKEHRPYCRSFVIRIYIKSKNVLFMRNMDAWEPMINAYNKIADMYNLDFVIKAEEPGQEIYLNSDATGRYFSERYIFEFFGESYAFRTFLIRKLEKLTKQTYFSNFAEISKALYMYGIYNEQDMEYFCEYIKNKYPDCEINFHKFKEKL
jgi:hypothetical protein